MSEPIPNSPVCRIGVEHVRGESRLVSSHVPSPLKLLNPAAPGGCCHLVMSNYGGGFLQGDRLAVSLHCAAGARLLLGSQANTRVYRSEGPVAGLELEARIDENALMVAMPDPVVPHAGSRFRQRQHWRLAPTARLALVETFVGGRLGTGERFMFDDFDSEVRISAGGRLALVDRLAIEPSRVDPTAPGAFGGQAILMTIYLVGAGMESPARTLETVAMSENSADSRSLICGCSPFKDAGWMVRIVADSREELQPVLKTLGKILSGSEFLGFDPLTRKW